jgi:hypothetical protein
MFALLGLEGWELAIIAGSGYVAVMALVRLMRRRHAAIVQDLARQIDVERQRRQARQRRAEQRELRDRLRNRRSRKVA